MQGLLSPHLRSRNIILAPLAMSLPVFSGPFLSCFVLSVLHLASSKMQSVLHVL